MKNYNRIMELFWLFATIAIILVVTFMGVKEGFSTWLVYYVLALMTSGTYLLRRFMRRRMERFAEQQNNQQPKQ